MHPATALVTVRLASQEQPFKSHSAGTARHSNAEFHDQPISAHAATRRVPPPTPVTVRERCAGRRRTYPDPTEGWRPNSQTSRSVRFRWCRNSATSGAGTHEQSHPPTGGWLADRFHPVPVLVWCFADTAGFAVVQAFQPPLIPLGTAAYLSLTIQVVAKLAGQTTFVVLPRRWCVERTFSWINRCRRTVRDYERRPDHHAAMVQWAMIILMARRLARHQPT
jgi:hypothetical protein